MQAQVPRAFAVLKVEAMDTRAIVPFQPTPPTDSGSMVLRASSVEDRGERRPARSRREPEAEDEADETAVVLSSQELFERSDQQLYGAIDRMMTTLVRSLELQSQM